ncbi:MAG: hypothetical protein ACJASM_000959 [Salibacteraceae bacterium]|jgi:hypothetical protein
METPSTINACSVDLTSPSKLPCAESCLNKCAKVSTSAKSLIAITSIPSVLRRLLNTSLPILPKPLIAILGIRFSQQYFFSYGILYQKYYKLVVKELTEFSSLLLSVIYRLARAYMSLYLSSKDLSKGFCH